MKTLVRAAARKGDAVPVTKISEIDGCGHRKDCGMCYECDTGLLIIAHTGRYKINGTIRNWMIGDKIVLTGIKKFEIERVE